MSADVEVRTVVVCDDHRQVGETICALLDSMPTFRVLGLAVDGPGCLRAVAASRPDILILDVSLPGGGTGLVRDVRATCPGMHIVMHSGRSELSVQHQMLDAGADTYVVKAGRLKSLIRALDPPPSDEWTADDPPHVAQFLTDDQAWQAELVTYARRSLAGSGRLMLVATAGHRAALRAALPNTLALAEGQGRLLVCRSEETLPLLIRGGRPDPAYFRHSVRPAVEAFRAGPGTLHLWGEMVGVLWAQGNVTGALELDELWNQMLREVPFAMTCPYPSTGDRSGNTEDEAAAGRLHTVSAGCTTV